MNAFAKIHADLSPSWPIRWNEAKGTWSETAVLHSIATDANLKGDTDVHCAALDAATATDPDERAEHIAMLERLFDDDGEPEGWGPADEDAGWRGSHVASVWGMSA